jgi:alkanesulfonate monooxygenase SsuD/methylene tetrahydromethanopterin reductase-like flavin-dependent oxidoreductase (luciferase family)
MTKIGIVIPEGLPSPEGIEFAISLENAGLDSAWFTEIDRDPFTRIAATATRTSKLGVGSAIALWNRHPLTSAMTAGELNEIAQGRFTFGLGSGPLDHNETLFGIQGARPATRMSEYLRILRGAFDASRDPFTFHGEYFDVSNFRQPYFMGGPPLLIAAVQKGMLRLAGRHADGVILNPASTPWYCRESAFSHLQAGAVSAGKTLDDVHRIVCARCAVADDGTVARNWARRSIVEYGRYPVHQHVYRLHGFERETAEIAASPEEVRKALRRWDGLVDTVALLPAAFEMGLDELRANCTGIRETFSR